MHPSGSSTRSQLVPSLDEVSEALHHNAVERRELQALKRLALARLRARPTANDTPRAPPRTWRAPMRKADRDDGTVAQPNVFGRRIAEWARLLNVSPGSIYRWIHEQGLRHVRGWRLVRHRPRS